MSDTKQDKVLYLFTATFPFGWGESYIKAELGELSKYFHQIYIFPRSAKGKLQPLPWNNVTVVQPPDPAVFKSSRSLLLRNMFLVTSILWKDIFKHKNKLFSVKKTRLRLAELAIALHLLDFIKTHKTNKPIIYYSFWMNEWALALALGKKKGIIPGFSFRILGYDIYDELWQEGYIPFRNFIYSQCTRVYAVSKRAADYVKKKGYFPSKVEHSYFGTVDHGFCASREDVFTILSCSRLYPVKRVPKIAEAIGRLPFPVKWIHHGDGECLPKVRAIVESFTGNVSFEHSLPLDEHEKVLQKFHEWCPDLFINYSESEGLPVTLIEAASFGIPILATDVGGTSEIVNEKTGILVPADCSVEQMVENIIAFTKSSMNSAEGHRQVRKFWEENFAAGKNYRLFFEKLVRED